MKDKKFIDCHQANEILRMLVFNFFKKFKKSERNPDDYQKMRLTMKREREQFNFVISKVIFRPSITIILKF